MGNRQKPTHSSVSGTDLSRPNASTSWRATRWLGMPAQRPREEWEHVRVTRRGVRYIDAEELLRDPRAKAQLDQLRGIA